MIRVFTFAAVFALTVAALRAAILLSAATVVNGHYLAGAALASTVDFLYGTGLALLYLKLRPRRAALLLPIALAVPLLFIKILCFHHEAVFGRLPGGEILFYARELAHLQSSLALNLPPLRIALEFALSAGVLLAAARFLLFPRTASSLDIPALLAGIPIVAIAILINVFPSMVPERYFAASREPLLWLAQSGMARENYVLDDLHLDGGDFNRFLVENGASNPGPAPMPAFPLCRARPASAGTAGKRSVVFLILESVGYREMIGDFQGQPLMPRLRAIAGENLSFSHAVAPGIKSVQALTALFSGLPAHPFNYYLWRTPFLTFDGIPRVLGDHGYDTGYFHGADLSFERQRQYLRAIGFSHIEEFDATSDTPSYGWGYDDHLMFARLRRWMETRQRNAKPYLATLFTLSSHDPYVLPPDWPPVFSTQTRVLKSLKNCCEIEGEADNAVAFAETLRFLDTAIGEFYDWYRALEAPPLLVIVGDHAPHLVNDNPEGGMRFDVPLVIAGLDPDRLPAYRSEAGRSASLHDIPVTVLAQLGMPPHECMAGIDLLAPETSAASSRFVYAAGPESLQEVHVWRAGGEYILNRATKRLRMSAAPTELPAEQAAAEVRRFIESSFPVHQYLMDKDAYFPRTRAIAVRATEKRRDGATLYASHRGNTAGPGTVYTENRAAALEAAIAAGFEWIELDVQLTRDGTPVVFHDAVVDLDGRATALVDLTLEQLRAVPGYEDVLRLDEALSRFLPRAKLLIEIKPAARPEQFLLLTREVARMVAARPPGSTVIIDSFDEATAQSVKQYCRCEVGLDTAFQRRLTEADVAHARAMGFDWIYVHHGVVDAELLRQAHRRGLKVMAYTLNDRALIERWSTEHGLPDGIITDRAALLP